MEGADDFRASGDVEGLGRYFSVVVPILGEANEGEMLVAIVED